MEYYRSAIILVVIMNDFHKIDAKLNLIPRNTEVKIDDATFMNCSTSLLANQVQWRHGNKYVYTGLAILEPYNDGRFSVEIDTSTGACNLVIRSVQSSDAGTYECAEDEGIGEQRTAQLIVLGGDPFCKSIMPSDGVIGPNSCGIEPEEVKLSCSIKYYGNILPILHWTASNENQSITDGLVDVTSINNEVTYTLAMKSTLGLNNTSYICQTTRTSDKHYSCSSNAIHIIYILSSEVTVDMTMTDEVNCLANSSQLCSYKWKWFSGDDISTASGNSILKPKKGGMHRCEATCSIRNKSCSVQSMLATVHSDEDVESRRLEEIELQRREEEERHKLLGLIATIRTKATKKMQKMIKGVTILNDELFVVSDESSKVEVYNSLTFNFSRQWNLRELIDPADIVSCHRNKCIYISDYKGVSDLSKEIFRVDRNGKVLKKWSTKDHFGRLSVAYDSNVIMISYSDDKIIEYSPDGQFIREIHLSSDEGFRHPNHAIKLTNGHFVVSHGFYAKGDDGLHRVCLVDADGKFLKSFGGKCGSTVRQTHYPVYLSIDGSGSVMVADYWNNRVLSLDSNLEFKKEILSYEHGLRAPHRILLDESNSRLFVTDIEPDNDRIMIFGLDLN